MNNIVVKKSVNKKKNVHIYVNELRSSEKFNKRKEKKIDKRRSILYISKKKKKSSVGSVSFRFATNLQIII